MKPTGTTEPLHPLQIILLLTDEENKPPPLSLVKIVYGANPAAISGLTSSYRATPLALACLKGCSVDVVAFLLDKDPSAVSKRCEGNLYCLHFACYYCHEAVVLLLGQFRDAAREKVRIDSEFCIFNEAYALDLAIESGAPLTVIESIYLAFPERMEDLHAHKGKPLFTALQHRPDDLELVRFLLERAPQAVGIEDVDGVTPLRAAACNQSPRVIAFVLENAPLPIHSRWTFLHGAVQFNTPDAVTFIVDQWPWMMETVCVGRGLPIHDACLPRSIRLDILVALLEKSRDSACGQRKRTTSSAYDLCQISWRQC